MYPQSEYDGGKNDEFCTFRTNSKGREISTSCLADSWQDEQKACSDTTLEGPELEWARNSTAFMALKYTIRRGVLQAWTCAPRILAVGQWSGQIRYISSFVPITSAYSLVRVMVGRLIPA